MSTGKAGACQNNTVSQGQNLVWGQHSSQGQHLLMYMQLYVYPKILIAVLSSYNATLYNCIFSRLSITMVMVGQV